MILSKQRYLTSFKRMVVSIFIREYTGEVRKKIGLTQKDIAVKLGLKQQSV